MKNVALLLATLCSVGCVAQNDPRLKKADGVATTVDSLKAKLDELETQVQGLQTDVFVLQGGVNPYETAVFDPGSPGGYSRIDTSGGAFLVSVKNVAPYVDGFRITCNFGNPSSVTFTGFKLKAKWGARRDFMLKASIWKQTPA